MRIVSTALLAALAASAFADRTANREWVTENFISRTNEWKVAEKRIALFILDLNADFGVKWWNFELKASTNNFANWSANYYCNAMTPWLYDFGGYDGMLLYALFPTVTGEETVDGRVWRQILTATEVADVPPRKIAVLIGPEQCAKGGDWLRESNENLVWCYLRATGSRIEWDSELRPLWSPVQPVKWFREMPAWALQQ